MIAETQRGSFSPAEMRLYAAVLSFCELTATEEIATAKSASGAKPPVSVAMLLIRPEGVVSGMAFAVSSPQSSIKMPDDIIAAKASTKIFHGAVVFGR